MYEVMNSKRRTLGTRRGFLTAALATGLAGCQDISDDDSSTPASTESPTRTEDSTETQTETHTEEPGNVEQILEEAKEKNEEIFRQIQRETPPLPETDETGDLRTQQRQYDVFRKLDEALKFGYNKTGSSNLADGEDYLWSVKFTPEDETDRSGMWKISDFKINDKKYVNQDIFEETLEYRGKPFASASNNNYYSIFTDKGLEFFSEGKEGMHFMIDYLMDDYDPGTAESNDVLGWSTDDDEIVPAFKLNFPLQNSRRGDASFTSQRYGEDSYDMLMHYYSIPIGDIEALQEEEYPVNEISDGYKNNQGWSHIETFNRKLEEIALG